MYHQLACWPNGKALDYGSRDCRFESCHAAKELEAVKKDLNTANTTITQMRTKVWQTESRYQGSLNGVRERDKTIDEMKAEKEAARLDDYNNLDPDYDGAKIMIVSRTCLAKAVDMGKDGGKKAHLYSHGYDYQNQVLQIKKVNPRDRRSAWIITLDSSMKRTLRTSDKFQNLYGKKYLYSDREGYLGAAPLRTNSFGQLFSRLRLP
ncbi:hypothetical protein BO70DRAFT_352112 [Aspergillus heteromorphus CBS 117.55]|uniref:Uncharacterized protein n=1 Tax=Aspergillus heteromorphus CBS 117.55 TaxID=1448321 RepID=A0A317WGA5_9EURO|nr:uncharacterized protein BO70DRAFT_352112 [Aspergillus heteromorphus CBS 117.55]PWY85005.1 hypothetical protein BO70DRAFT_352112 [Aspergillus heteromorphus CBS 117.55]